MLVPKQASEPVRLPTALMTIGPCSGEVRCSEVATEEGAGRRGLPLAGEGAQGEDGKQRRETVHGGAPGAHCLTDTGGREHRIPSSTVQDHTAS
jgi:hypothetical protein